MLNSPSQVIVAKDAMDLIDFEHLKSAVSDANEKLLKNSEELGEQSPTVTSGLDSLDDILFKLKTTVRGVGKFRPKPKDSTTTSKSFTAVIPPVDMVPVLYPPPATPSKDTNSAPIDPSSKVVAQDADPVEVENSEAVVSDANENIQMTDERLGKQTPTVTSVSESLDDIFFQPAKTTVRGIGKFQPKPKAPTTFSKSIAPVIPHYVVAPVPSPSTTTSNIAEFVSPPFDPQLSPQIEGLVDRLPLCDTPTSVSFDPLTTGTCFSAPIETSSQLLIDQEDANPTDDVHFKAAVSDANENSQLDHENLGMEAPTVASGVDSLEIHFQHITTAVNLPYDSTHSQHVTQQSSDRSETHLETAVAGGDGYLQTDPVTSKREGTKGRKRRTSISVQETVEKSSTISEENEAGDMRMQLRKRKAVLSHVDENGDGIEENSNINIMDDKNGSDNEYNGKDGEDTMKRRKVPRRTKGPETKTDKPSQRRKKASHGADPINKEPAKKKFCHSTRRNRRTVSKELLETPEEDIDHSKLRMKDLIILAEIKERRSNKEAEALKKSFPYQSADNSTPNDAPYDDEDPLASTEGLNPEDDRANLKYESSCPKLNYHSFMNRTPTERWSKSDTEMFYEAIRQFGSDFAMIQQLFPGRTRHQVKLKFKAEERKHPLQVNDALSHRSKDLSHFALVIERLQEAQAEQNANTDADLPDAPSENEEQGVESEPKGEEVAKEELEVHSPVKSNASQDYFDRSQYETADEPYLKDREEFEYVSF
eukprot:TRINITY_DN2942_c0_g1_i2.p1 TRINITY_DN2942_c0_g1~~TRINITY_DN2942_c0_g1_i2.p1  ORF type:complete len:764 (-),score=187.86 TRINITY_DN2942_c0_g1_i2:522-2813(-)